MGMRTFCGVIMRKQVRVDPALIETMMKVADPQGENMESVYAKRFAVAAMDDQKGRTHINGTTLYRDETIAGTFDGRIDNLKVRSETRTRVRSAGNAIENNTEKKVSPPDSEPVALTSGNTDLNPQELPSEKYIFKSILINILKYIYEDPSVLRGDFAAAVYDIREDRLVLARDPLGARPLYYTEMADYIAFATEMKFLKALPGFVPEMDETWIADAISTVQSEKWRTPYRNIYRVLPGHLLVFDQAVRQDRYWDLEVDENVKELTYEQAVEVFRKKLFTSIENRIKGDSSIAAELSGGLDSSGVTSIMYQLAAQSGQSLYALTHAFSDASLGKFFPYSDEREFSKEVCQFIGLEHQIMCDADNYGLPGMLKRNVLVQSGPTQQGYSMFSDTLYDRAKEKGITKLLSGFGGDEGVTSKAGGFFDELARHGQWDLFRKEFLNHERISDTTLGSPGRMNPGALTRRMRKEAAYLLRRYFPAAKNFLSEVNSRSDWRKDKYPGLGFTSEFEERMNIKKRYFERLGFPDDPDVRARQYKRILHDHVSQRFEYSYIDAKAYGIEYAYPLWDIDLLEFYYSLPAEFKFRNGMGRAIYRDALKGLLPDKIRLRNDKTGATVPTVQQRFVKDYDEITDLIERSRLQNKYHYLDYDRMLAWQKRMLNRGFKDKVPANPSAFFNSLQILLLQEMERTGEFRSGIRT